MVERKYKKLWSLIRNCATETIQHQPVYLKPFSCKQAT
jgi:hypothetical protein